LNRVGEAAQRGYGSIFTRANILRIPLPGELWNIEQNQTQRDQPPAAIFPDQAEIGFLAVDDRHRNKCQILAGANIAEAKLNRMLGSFAAEHGVAVVIRGNKRFAGAFGQREPLQERRALVLGQRAVSGGAVRRQVVGELRLVLTAGSAQRSREGARRIGFMGVLRAKPPRIQ